MNNTASSQDTLLVIDDMPANILLLRKFLTTVGFNVLIAKNGKEGIKLAESVSPDLILLDIMIPDINGFEICRYLKSQPNTQAIPVIFMTALAETSNQVKGLELGAADYITKPFEREEVLARINTHLKLRKLQLQLIEQNQRLQTEITVRQQTEKKLRTVLEALHESEERFDLAMRGANDGLWDWNLETNEVYYSQRWKQILGFADDEITDCFEEWHKRIHPESLEQVVRDIENYLEKKVPAYENLHRIQHKDGHYVWILCRGIAIWNEHGKADRFVGTIMDMTAQKQAEEALTQAKEVAEVANRAKTTFLANMSHELRTPLNGILGYAQIIKQDKNLTSQQQEGIMIIQRSGEYLLTLINDMLELSKMEAERLTLFKTDFYFDNFLKAIIELFQIQAEQKGISFQYQPLTRLPYMIHADEIRLRQILINLLSNAIKFTKQGEVIFKVGYHQNKIRFIVSDTGRGIAPKELSQIFLPFQQVGERDYQTQGIGLGLAISKKLAEMMGEELHVESTLGQGSKFWIELDLPEVLEAIPEQIDNSVIMEEIKETQVKNEWDFHSITGPSPQQAATLFNFTMRGDINRIIGYANELEQTEAALKPFTTKIKELAEQFQIKQIREIAKYYRDTVSI